MEIPVAVESTAWAALDRAAKRERLLEVAANVFAREGLDATMADLARAAGAGVASVYRLYESKRELLAALVVARRDQVAAAADRALARPGERWDALVGMLWDLALARSAADFPGDARHLQVADHPDVVAAGARATAALDRLVAAARAEGRLRADATTLDLRLALAAARAASRVEPDGWRRMLQLTIDGLDAGGGRAGR